MHSNVIQNIFVLSSDFYKKIMFESLLKLDSSIKVKDYFDFNNQTISQINQNVLSYDLTNSLSGYLLNPATVSDIESNKKIVKGDDLIISRLRSYLKECAVVDKQQILQIVSSEYFVLRKNDSSLISSHTLQAYLLSKYVQKIFECSQYGTEHPRLYDFILSNLTIPKCVINLNFIITDSLIKAHNNLKESKQLYTEAEEILYRELGLHDFIPSNEPVNIKNFSESFGVSGRLDAEYYQKKYEEMVNQLKKYKYNFDILENICHFNNQNFNPNENELYQYIELSNIGINGEITTPEYELGVNLPSRARRQVKKNDVIISSIEGSLSSCAMIPNKYHNAICSTGFYVLNSTIINPETLLILFKSVLIQNTLKKICSGTILTAFSIDELRKIPIPLIHNEIQQKIADKIQESFNLREESERTLQNAVRAVEIAIEENEESAMKFLKDLNIVE